MVYAELQANALVVQVAFFYAFVRIRVLVSRDYAEVDATGNHDIYRNMVCSFEMKCSVYTDIACSHEQCRSELEQAQRSQREIESGFREAWLDRASGPL